MPIAQTPELSRREVLIVEDDPEINQLLGDYVELAGYRYIGALSGSAALVAAEEYAPSVVILDIMLPDFNGWEVCMRLKANSGTQDIPVIMLTALDSDDCRQQGLRCGACEYLTKPFDPDQLLRILQHHITRIRPRDAAPAGRN